MFFLAPVLVLQNTYCVIKQNIFQACHLFRACSLTSTVSIIFLVSGKNSWTGFSLHRNYRIEVNAIGEKHWYHVDKNRALSSAVHANGKHVSVRTAWLGPKTGFNISRAQPFPQGNCQLRVRNRKDADYLGQTLLLFVSEQYPWLHSLLCHGGSSLALCPQFPGLSLNHRNNALRWLLGQLLMAGKSTVLLTLRHCKFWKERNLCCIFLAYNA